MSGIAPGPLEVRLLEVVLINAAVAAALTLLVAIAGRALRGRPRLVHGVLTVILLKLLMPPLAELRILPSWSSTLPAATALEASQAALVARAPTGSQASPAGIAASPGAPVPTLAERVVSGLVVLWLLGAVGVLGLAQLRGRRFRRLVGPGRPSPDLQAAVDRIGAAMGLRRSPRVRLIDARISPLLWRTGARLELLFPAALVDLLRIAERDALLAHELVHARRGDHWRRLLEQATTALYWWYPLVWWVRTRLRWAEELSCDLEVVTRCDRRDYSRGLLIATEFLSGATPPPTNACGAAAGSSIKERMMTILSSTPAPTRRPLTTWGLAAAAAAVLVAYPTWRAQPVEAATASDATANDNDNDQAYRQQMLDLERHAASLEQELHDVQRQRLDLERQRVQVRTEQEQARLRKDLEAARQQGESAAVAAAESRLRARQQASALEQQRLELEAARMHQVAELEMPLRQLRLEQEELRAKGQVQEAKALGERARKLEVRLAEEAKQADQRSRKVETAILHRRLAEMTSELAQLREAGQTTQALELEQHIDKLQHHLRMKSNTAAQDRTQALHHAADELAHEVDTLRAAGRAEEAAAMERKLEAVRTKLQAER